ncbi:hypothetical protein MHK_000361 [Candidatus Magnetomorum sp. HK-1]|nr:hypothetical protein MHK_000361 [Candidatus Magnetomorum sp. HK-1]
MVFPKFPIFKKNSKLSERNLNKLLFLSIENVRISNYASGVYGFCRPHHLS